MNNEIRRILEQVQSGALDVDEAALRLKLEPFAELGYAKVDTHRKLRQGIAEVIYGAGKTAEQIVGIISAMKDHGQALILVTRLDSEKAALVQEVHTDMRYYGDAHMGIAGEFPQPDGNGPIVVATGGTSDIPVAEEAALTAQALGNRVERLYDVGWLDCTGSSPTWKPSCPPM